MFFTRRELVLLAGLAGTATAATIVHHRLKGISGRKLVVLLLRGGMDGLSALAPPGDARYRALRGELALSEGLPAAEGFVLHPSLSRLSSFFDRGEALALPASAIPLRERSHFEAQAALESGAGSTQDGWLNRALARLGSDAPDAIGFGPSLPFILRGEMPAANWTPSVLPEADPDTISRLIEMHERDSLLAGRLERAERTDRMAERASGRGDRPAPELTASTEEIVRAAGRLLASSGGPDLGVISLGGWDTHARQGAETGTLARSLHRLDRVISRLHGALRAHWPQTVILAVTEFGRTVRVNGSGGTDHGTASTAFLLGGAVRGGRLIGDWPGLDRLYEDRDLRPANSLIDLFKAVLAGHWGLDARDLAHVFPDDRFDRGFSDLIV